MRRAPPGTTQSINRYFRAHPIMAPLTLLVVGAVAVVLAWLVITASQAAPGPQRPRIGLGITLLLGFGIITFGLGVITLPIGLVAAAHRRRHPVTLRCPGCGLDSATAAVPFRIDRPGHVDYLIVTCPACDWEFTADKYVRFS